MNDHNTGIVFLIGAARSGTKFLRDVLASSAYVSAVPFDVNYVWRYGHEGRPDDHIPPADSTDRARRYIENAIFQMAKPSPVADRTMIIEKTVSNVFRIPYIYRLFPEARFVYLLRDGRDVAESATRMWKEPVNFGYLVRKARSFPIRHHSYAVWFVRNLLKVSLGIRGKQARIWGPRYPGIEKDLKRLSVVELAARQWTESVRAAAAGLEAIPAGKKISILYEDLVSDTAALESVLDFLAVQDADTVIGKYKSVVRPDLRGKWKRLTQDEQRSILAIQGEILGILGYNDTTISK